MVHHQDLAAPAAVVLDADDVSFFERQQSASCGDRVPAAAAACKFKILAAIHSIRKYILQNISYILCHRRRGFSLLELNGNKSFSIHSISKHDFGARTNPNTSRRCCETQII
jgi:hypothetical protein